MNALGHAGFGYLEKKWKLFTRKLLIRDIKFYKNTSHHVKTTTSCLYLEQELHSDEMSYKACVPPDDIEIEIGDIWQ